MCFGMASLRKDVDLIKNIEVGCIKDLGIIVQ